MKLFSFYKTAKDDPGEIDLEVVKGNNDSDIHEDFRNMTEQKGIWCNTCKIYKPARTNHCKICDKCYLRLYHHCFIVGNCIALKNLKSFVLFNIYGLLETVIAFGVSITLFLSQKNIITFWTSQEGIINFSFLLISGITMTTFGSIVYTEMYLIIYNITTNEFNLYYGDLRDSKYYSDNFLENFRVIFGENSWIEWFYPNFIYSKENDGYHYSENLGKNKSQELIKAKEKVKGNTQVVVIRGGDQDSYEKQSGRSNKDFTDRKLFYNDYLKVEANLSKSNINEYEKKPSLIEISGIMLDKEL